jgi:hypothetical protein
MRPICLLAGLAASLTACLSGPAAQPDGGVGANDATAAAPTSDAGAPTVSVTRDGGVPISPFAFGQNYWNWLSSNGTSGMTGTEPLVTALHLNVVRAGGSNNDTNVPQLFDTNQIDKFVAYCRIVGAEPILQVPLVTSAVDGGASTAQSAADLVTYANVTKGYGIKYWEIGNEPDLYTSQTLPAVFTVIGTASEYCAQFSAYVTAMKAANASGPDGGAPMQFLGPELSYKYTPGSDWLTPFLDGCKDYVDIVTIHRYPFSGAQTSVNGAFADVTKFRSTLRAVAAIVKGHARPNTPIGLTEANISYDYDPTKYTSMSLLAGPGSYPAAIWTADMMGVALENNLWTLAFWNIGEQNAAGSVLGYIVGGQPTPAYYAEQMVSANFRGSELSPSGVPTGFSVYASYDPSQGSTAVLVVNKTMTSAPLALSVDSLAVQSFDFPAASVTLVQIPDAPDGITHVLRYTADLAAANMPPKMIQ